MTTPLDHDNDLTDDVSADLTGQFLKQSDFQDRPAALFTIAAVEKHHFDEKGGRPAQDKWVLTFDTNQSLSLNQTNLQLLAKWFGRRSRAWIGERIVVYRDESITFGGRLVGGLRVRKPAKSDNKAAPSQRPTAMAGDALDDVPF